MIHAYPMLPTFPEFHMLTLSPPPLTTFFLSTL